MRGIITFISMHIISYSVLNTQLLCLRCNGLKPLLPFNLVRREEVLKDHILIRRLVDLEVAKPVEERPQRNIKLSVRQPTQQTC